MSDPATDHDGGTDTDDIVILKKIGYYAMIIYFGYMSISLVASIPAVIQEYKIWSRYVLVGSPQLIECAVGGFNYVTCYSHRSRSI